MARTVRFAPRRLLLIAILIPVFLFVALIFWNRVGYDGIMVPTTPPPEGVSWGDNLLYITTNRFTHTTFFGIYVENTNSRTLTAITIHVRLLNDEGDLVASSEGQGVNMQPGGGQWIRGNFDRSGSYTKAEYDVTSIEWR